MATGIVILAYVLAVGMLAAYVYFLTPAGRWVDGLLAGRDVPSPEGDLEMGDVFDLCDWADWPGGDL